MSGGPHEPDLHALDQRTGMALTKLHVLHYHPSPLEMQVSIMPTRAYTQLLTDEIKMSLCYPEGIVQKSIFRMGAELAVKRVGIYQYVLRGR